jgi:hypothetical protein
MARSLHAYYGSDLMLHFFRFPFLNEFIDSFSIHPRVEDFEVALPLAYDLEGQRAVATDSSHALGCISFFIGTVHQLQNWIEIALKEIGICNLPRVASAVILIELDYELGADIQFDGFPVLDFGMSPEVDSHIKGVGKSC